MQRMYLRVEAEPSVIDALFSLIKPSDGTKVSYGPVVDVTPAPTRKPIARHRTAANGGLAGALAQRFGLGEEFTLDQARAAAEEMGCARSSASGAMSDLVAGKFAERLAEGKYRILSTVPPGFQFNVRRTGDK